MDWTYGGAWLGALSAAPLCLTVRLRDDVSAVCCCCRDASGDSIAVCPAAGRAAAPFEDALSMEAPVLANAIPQSHRQAWLPCSKAAWKRTPCSKGHFDGLYGSQGGTAEAGERAACVHGSNCSSSGTAGSNRWAALQQARTGRVLCQHSSKAQPGCHPYLGTTFSGTQSCSVQSLMQSQSGCCQFVCQLQTTKCDSHAHVNILRTVVTMFNRSLPACTSRRYRGFIRDIKRNNNHRVPGR
jgi:hypothetical protein